MAKKVKKMADNSVVVEMVEDAAPAEVEKFKQAHKPMEEVEFSPEKHIFPAFKKVSDGIRGSVEALVGSTLEKARAELDNLVKSKDIVEYRVSYPGQVFTEDYVVGRVSLTCMNDHIVQRVNIE